MTETHLAYFIGLLLLTLSVGFLIGLTMGALWLFRNRHSEEIGYQSKEITPNEWKPILPYTVGSVPHRILFIDQDGKLHERDSGQ